VPERIVVTGAGGQVGRFLAGRLAGREVLALASAQWDITDPVAGQHFLRPGDVVVNCAALTAVDDAEADPGRAFAVNAAGAGNVARACAVVGARLLHISTDYVFSGRFDGAPRPYQVDDPTEPISIYGRSKRDGELAVLAELPQAQVLRTAWVYTGSGTDFVATMVRLAAGDGVVDVVADQIGSPTYVGDLVAAIIELIDRPVAAPVLHIANDGAVSRYEQARMVFAGVGADPDRVRPVSSAVHPRPAARPQYSALSVTRFAELGGTPMRPWQAGLSAALEALD
jgi:dTDP-4-dehydrorhamnose reductase